MDKHTHSYLYLVQRVELSTVDMASKEIYSLKQVIHDIDEEISQLTHLLAAKETNEEERKSGYEEVEDDVGCEISDIRARLENTFNRKMKAEEELNDLQSRLKEMKHKEMVRRKYQCSSKAGWLL